MIKRRGKEKTQRNIKGKSIYSKDIWEGVVRSKEGGKIKGENCYKSQGEKKFQDPSSQQHLTAMNKPNKVRMKKGPTALACGYNFSVMTIIAYD